MLEGTYRGHFEITKPVQVVTAGRAVVLQAVNPFQPVVHIASEGETITDVSVQGRELASINGCNAAHACCSATLMAAAGAHANSRGASGT